jgi:UDPglucose 6-dehydrogenase
MQHVTIVGGAGFVGLVTGACLAKLGHRVICQDINSRAIQDLQDGRLPFDEPGLLERVQEGIYSGRLRFMDDIQEALHGATYVIVAVPTPEGVSGKADLRMLHEAIRQIAIALAADYAKTQNSEDITIMVKSTVPVGCFEELERIMLDLTPEVLGFHLVSCPEFLAEGSAVADFEHPSRIIIGADDQHAAQTVDRELFDGIEAPRLYTNVATAQMIKYLSNALLASRVSLVNEAATICDALNLRGLDIDIHQVETGVLFDPRFGRGYFRAGIGYGGSCLKKDVAELIQTANLSGVNAHVLDAIAMRNKTHIENVAKNISALIPNEKPARVVIFGAAFKAGTSDCRNSPALEIACALGTPDRTIIVSDPVAGPVARQQLDQYGITCLSDPWQAMHEADLLAFLVAWPQYSQFDLADARQLVRTPILFDGPGMFDPAHVRKAGFNYHAIGRPSIILENFQT